MRLYSHTVFQLHRQALKLLLRHCIHLSVCETRHHFLRTTPVIYHMIVTLNHKPLRWTSSTNRNCAWLIPNIINTQYSLSIGFLIAQEHETSTYWHMERRGFSLMMIFAIQSPIHPGCLATGAQVTWDTCDHKPRCIYAQPLPHMVHVALL